MFIYERISIQNRITAVRSFLTTCSGQGQHASTKKNHSAVVEEKFEQ